MPPEPLSARELILTLIDSTASETLSARYFVAAGEVCGADPGSIRVALGRLVRDGSLRQTGRGMYSLGSRAGTLHRLVRNWSQVEDSVKAWHGDWLAVFTAHLTRSDKTRLRNRERALRLFGFAEAQPGFWIRPDNLVTALEDVYGALTDLGLERAAMAFQMGQLVPEDAVPVDTLWDTRHLESRYRAHLQTLAESTQHLQRLDERDAARETLLVGRAVTRDILLDPLLPDALVDTGLRQDMVNAMRVYDRGGRPYWRALYEQYN